MLSVRLLACAQGVIRDADTNQCTVINLVENLVVPSLPFVVPSLCLFAIIERGIRDPTSCTCSVRVRLNDAEVFGRDLAIDFGPALRNRTILYLEELPIDRAGVIQCRLLHETTTLGAWDMAVMRADPPADPSR